MHVRGMGAKGSQVFRVVRRVKLLMELQPEPVSPTYRPGVRRALLGPPALGNLIPHILHL